MFPTSWKKNIFSAIYSSRPRLGCVHSKEIFQKFIKTGFLLQSGVSLVCPLNWNSKIGRYSSTNFEKVFEIYFFDHLQKISNQIQNQAIRIKPKIFTQNYKNETPLLKTTPGNCSQNLTNFEAKNILFSPHSILTGKTRPTSVYIVKIQPKNSNNTLERLSKEKHILPKTKLNLHIISFRRPSSSARRLGFTQKLPQKPAKSKNTMQKLLSRTSCVCSSGNFPPFS